MSREGKLEKYCGAEFWGLIILDQLSFLVLSKCDFLIHLILNRVMSGAGFVFIHIHVHYLFS